MLPTMRGCGHISWVAPESLLDGHPTTQLTGNTGYDYSVLQGPFLYVIRLKCGFGYGTEYSCESLGFLLPNLPGEEAAAAAAGGGGEGMEV